MKTSAVVASLDVLQPREFLRILIHGERGSGRGDFAQSFSNAIIIDASNTLYEHPDRPDVPILRSADPRAIESLVAQINEGLVSPTTIVVHGFPFIAEFIEREEQHIKGFDGYVAVRDRLLSLMAALRTVRANLVVTTRSKKETAKVGQIFGGRLVTDSDRIVLDAVPDIHKTLPDQFDLIFEMVRGGGLQPMAAVKNSALPELHADEVIVPDGNILLQRLHIEPQGAALAPTPEAYGAYLRLRREADAYGIDTATLNGIRDRACAKERTGKHLTADEIDDITVRLIAYLAGHDPLCLEPEAPEQTVLDTTPQPANVPDETPPTVETTIEAAVVTETAPISASLEPQAQLALDAKVTATSEPEKDEAPSVIDAEPVVATTNETTSKKKSKADAAPEPEPVAHAPQNTPADDNVVSITAKTPAAPPSPAQPEWMGVKDALARYNVLLEQAGRSNEIIPTVTAFIKHHSFYDDVVNDQVLAKADHALAATELLNARIAELTEQRLPRAS